MSAEPKRMRHGVVVTLVLGGLALVLAVAAVGVARATDSPSFCRAACHEMRPYHAAWTEGPHADVSCVQCHVDDGVVARLAHKAVATKELWIHATGDPKFPLPENAEVPNERCVACHESVTPDSPGFDHAAHAAKGDCQDCHSTAGHEVSAASLKAEGVYRQTATPVSDSSKVAAVDAGSANLADHPSVACSRCHDMAATGCAACHTPDHEGRGQAKKTAECTTCHKPGIAFAFAHPAEPGDCAGCHTVPAAHTYRGTCATCHSQPGKKWAFSHSAKADCTNCHTTPAAHRAGPCASCHQAGGSWAFRHPASNVKCADCHKVPAKHSTRACATCHKTGVSWAFAHPSSAACTNCHPRPAGHRSGACVSCHRAGASWAFSHPRGSAKCTSCHARPAKHSTRSCTTCHRTGASWAFRHPGTSASCTNCHSRPGGHRSGACVSCHSTSSWKFRHPSSKSCSSCHKAPGNHYGSSCASCHSPSRAWSSAKFSHPRIPGGEHTYKSFACSKCHPSGYGSHTCAKCHDSASGPKDDD